jgi:hypothetical protein
MKMNPWMVCAASIAIILTAASAAANAAENPTPENQRRQAAVRAAQQGIAGLPVLESAMKDQNILVRRAALRGLERIGAPAVSVLSRVSQEDADALIRRSALRALLRLASDRAGELLTPALKDPSAVVRQDVVEQLAALQPRTPQVVALLKQAQKDPSSSVSLVASTALWPFHKEAESTQERAEWRDTQLSVASTVPLPQEGWRFRTDPRGEGHEQNWFGTEYKDADWSAISIGKYWEDLDQNYDGVAWYRGTFDAPAKPTTAFAGVDVVFGGVDESAWVWVNGEYAGQHDVGPGGYNEAFRMEVTPLLKWGQPNQISVRVLDRSQGGGIWKPITLEILKR